MAIISTLLEQAGNVRTLKISYQRGRVCRIRRVSRIHAILPRHIKDLCIELMRVEDLHLIFDRLTYLSTATFVYSSFENISNLDIIEWLNANLTDFIYQESSGSIHVWLGKYMNKRATSKVGAKRVKLTHDA